MSPIFHLAIPVSDLETTKTFYVEGLGCEVGRESKGALILNFYGHQVVAHTTEQPLTPQVGIYPRHFGLIFLAESEWEKLLETAKRKSLKFYQQPKRRFSGQLTEHRTFFLEDPSYNILEFKYYSHYEAIFGGRELAAVGDREK